MARIYVCDDDERFLSMISAVLTEGGHAVFQARQPSGLAALLIGAAPDLAIIDIQTEGGGGPRCNSILPIHVPVLVISGMPIRFQQQWIVGRPLVRFLEKPIQWAALEAALRELGLISDRQIPHGSSPSPINER